MKKIKLGDNAIMFGDIKGCDACKSQDQILKSKFKSGHFLYKHVPINKIKNYPELKDISGIPCWYIPTGNGSGYLQEGVIQNPTKKLLQKKLLQKKVLSSLQKSPLKLLQKSPLKLLQKRRFRFGDVIPEIGTLAKYGRNFPDGNSFQIPNSWNNEVTNTWVNPLNSGTLGREFGPGNTDQIYTNKYFNDIRMAYPGGDLDTTLNLNRSCNVYNPVPTSGENAYPVLNSAGMIYDSPNPQIVNNSFGKSNKFKRIRSKFGNLYQQMGTVPEKNYLLNSKTFNDMYAGGGTFEPSRPYKVNNSNIFIGQSPIYYPLKTSFGAKIPKIPKIPKIDKIVKQGLILYNRINFILKRPHDNTLQKFRCIVQPQKISKSDLKHYHISLHKYVKLIPEKCELDHIMHDEKAYNILIPKLIIALEELKLLIKVNNFGAKTQKKNKKDKKDKKIVKIVKPEQKVQKLKNVKKEKKIVKKEKPGEGSILTIKNGKIKVKN